MMLRWVFRCNLAFLGILALMWAGTTTAKPLSGLAPRSERAQGLADLEDAVAHHPSDVDLARALVQEYLDMGRPGLAIAALRATDAELIEHPAIAHRLAQAYEASGRVLDAYATAELALARCARSRGTADAPSGTPVPRFRCAAQEYVVLRIHRQALSHMVEWGVAEPTRDQRTERAYALALRRARIASL